MDDNEQLRIATENRIRSLDQVKGVPSNAKTRNQLEAILTGIEESEKASIKLLTGTLKSNPFYPWIKAQIGIGDKQGARLLAAIGHPVLRVVKEEEELVVVRRTISQLWSYCGYAPGQKRKKGVKSNWNSIAKMRAFLCAESCIKQMHSPYWKVYDEARSNWADRDVIDGHKDIHAKRLVAKAILKDLWIEGDRLLKGE